MTIVNASELVKTHIRWIWEAPDDANERSTAAEAVAALFALAEGWIEIIAIEARLGFHDHETYTEAQTRPEEPWRLLRRQSSDSVRIKPMYRPIESVTPALDATATAGWIDTLLGNLRPPEARLEPSLRELLVAGARVRLPEDAASAPLRVNCYAGEIEVPADLGWVTAPFDPPGVPDPVTLRVSNLDGMLRLVLEVRWSPWASHPEPVAPIRDGLLRLRSRNWRSDE